MQKLPKHKQNLSIVQIADKQYVKSYDTLVAEIYHFNNEIKVLGYWSPTTSRHINYVASYFNYKLIKK